MPKSREGLARLVERDGASSAVVRAFRTVDRADFVPEGARSSAYDDRPIAIPQRQTTSQPSLIARMIDVVRLAEGADATVLEVGGGFGFQTALLAHIAARVVSIERHDELARAARANLRSAGITNVVVVTGDGWQGAPEHAPFDAIVVSAAASAVPPALGEQLVEGGRLVIPVQGRAGDEVLLFVKQAGELTRERLITPARFVPLVPGDPQRAAVAKDEAP